MVLPDVVLDSLKINAQQHDDDDYEEEMFESVRTARPSPRRTNAKRRSDIPKPSLEPYIAKLERFELFSTNQCYYIVACDKYNIQYRVLKMDRTLIEHPADEDELKKPNPEGEPFDAMHCAKPTLRPLQDFLTEDPHTYTQDEIQGMLDMIHHGNRYTRSDTHNDGDGGGGGGLKPLAKAYGIVGFIRFLDCYYLTLITRRAKIGSIGYNGIYAIKNVETFPLKPAERFHGGGDDDPLTDPSAMLLKMWNRGKRSVGLGLTNREIAELRYQGLYQVVDFTKNFYFSYSYDLTRSMQENFLATTSQPFPPPPYKDMYAWNFFLTRELEECTNSLTSYHWIMPIIHGAYVQRKLNDYGRTLNLALIARRSRHFAGTRYLKRGVSEQGKVANDVEHEQIVHDESKNITGGTFSSFLQVRGSIPTFWTQESSVTMPKPPIEINRVDPTYRATQAHFEDLFQRYGSPIIVLDLIKQSEKREREVRVGREYRHAIDYINTSIDDDKHKLRYTALDYSHVSKHRHLDVSTSLNEVATYAVNQTGFFCSAPRWKIIEGGMIVPFGERDKIGAEFLSEQLGVPVFPMEQRGILRTNCIDCLDRTNVAQFSAGVQALEQQLIVMGIRSSAKLDPSSTIIRVLIDMYVEIGDHISLQYGGSEAHKKVNTERSDASIHGPIGKHKELLTSIRRYYSNAFTDRLKQDAMNLLLGYYIPYMHAIPLWELETDYYLHNLHVKAGRGTSHTMRTYEKAFGVDWSDDVDTHADRDDLITSGSLRRAKLEKIRGLRKGKSDDSKEPETEPTEANESFKIARVRRRLKSQKHALSAWWRSAIQSHIKQRMWIQLGKSPSESLMPPRFDRIYQPNKLAQFDRFFSRGWAVPVRRAHASEQGKGGSEEVEQLDYCKKISDVAHPTDQIKQVKVRLEGASLDEFHTNHGYSFAHAPTLNRFIADHARDEPSIPMNTPRDPSSRRFVGRIGDTQTPCEEYLKYTSSNPEHSLHPFQSDRIEELRKCLQDTSLPSDDVVAIRKLAESAHIGNTIRSGPYRGLDQNESAVEITTVILEQLNSLVSKQTVDEVSRMNLVDKELRRRGYHTAGVSEAVSREWERTQIAKAQYAEIVGNSNASCRRSDLSTPDDLEQYSSFFGDSVRLSPLDLIFIRGEKQKEKFEPATRVADPYKGEFVKKAAEVGITIQSHDDVVHSQLPSIFAFSRNREVPASFEQINDDLFARKDNKFMVFNGAGVDSWYGTEPVTKITTTSGDTTSLDELSRIALLETVGATFHTTQYTFNIA